LGYHGVVGEIHIDRAGHWQSCPGQDNGDTGTIRLLVAI
jgi:hypothetical protein